MYRTSCNFAPRFGMAQQIPIGGPGVSRGVRHLLHAGGYEHVVQQAAQRADRLSRDPAERQLHARRSRLQFRAAGCWANGHQLHGIRSASAAAVHPAMERVRAEEPRAARPRSRSGITASAGFTAALAPDQQCAAGPGADPAAASLSERHVPARHRFPAGRDRGEQHDSGQHGQLAGEHGAELVRRRLCQCAAALFERA